MMNVFKRRYCKTRITAFINKELSPHAHRRVARYIDECPECYEEYIHQRALQQDLKEGLSTLVMPDKVRRDRIWAGIQSDLWATPRQNTNRSYSTRYGLVTLTIVVVVLTLVLPDQSHVSRAAVTQPTPIAELVVMTDSPPALDPIAYATRIPVNLVIDQEESNLPEAVPARTPGTEE